ncbi:hypothetical protein ACIQV3_32255 [Streptomyces sp. NPDC099050]|uniref:hypothetical protein n=1 Tax=Streptomyces sp. NPDC099050 TaxID=3366100 RepID=UPI0038005CC1
MTRMRKFGKRVASGLALTGIGIGALFFFGMAPQLPTGWGVAFTFGDRVVDVRLPGSCEMHGRGRGKRDLMTCEGTRWTSDGQVRTGTLHSNKVVYRDSTGPVFKGEARVLGGRAYGRPDRWIVVLHLAAVGAAVVGVAVVLFAALGLVPAPARRRP